MAWHESSCLLSPYLAVVLNFTTQPCVSCRPYFVSFWGKDVHSVAPPSSDLGALLVRLPLREKDMWGRQWPQTPGPHLQPSFQPVHLQCCCRPCGVNTTSGKTKEILVTPQIHLRELQTPTKSNPNPTPTIKMSARWHHCRDKLIWFIQPNMTS